MLSKLYKMVLFFFLTVSILAQSPSFSQDSNKPTSNTTLTHTYWKLITLLKEDVESNKMSREAHLIFETLENGKGKFKGASGCNAMLGTYQSSDQNLTIDYKHIAMTRMACPEGDVEMAFLKAIQGTVKWQIKDHHLAFIDMNSSVLAEFRATDLK